jgi:hypothetical protein
MKLGKLIRMTCIVIILYLIAGTGVSLEAQNIKSPGIAVEKKEDVKKEPSVKYEVSDELLIDIQGVSAGIGGGYFSPLGDMKKVLKDTWGAKIYVQNNSLGMGLMGYGFDLSYAYPPDKEIKGGIRYIIAVPYLTVNMPLGVVELQLKFGAGITVVNNVIRSSQSTSGDLTGMAGASLIKVFAGHYVAGIEADCYYIMELKSQSAFASYFFLGYKF